MKLALRVFAWAGAVLGTCVLLTSGLSLLNGNDISVLAGVGVLLALAVAWALVARKLWRRMTTLTKPLGAFALLGLVTLTTSCTTIKPGYVGIVVHQTGTDRGVQSYVGVTGRQWYNPLTYTVFEYPTFVQTAVWTHNTDEGNAVNEEITFTTADSMAVAADISLGYSLMIDKVPAFYVKFRSDDLNTFTHGFLRNLARDHFNEAGGKYNVMQVMGDNEPFIMQVRARLQKDLDPIGIKLEQFGFIGAPRPPEAVIASINAKVQAGQIASQKQTEIIQAEAEAKKTIAKAQGEAEANRTLAQSITPQLMNWKQLGILEQATAKWDGRRPMVEGNGSGMLLQLQVPETK